MKKWFRSTGSYEPDQGTPPGNVEGKGGFDPQALTSLTPAEPDREGLVRGFEPQALTSLTIEYAELPKL